MSRGSKPHVADTAEQRVINWLQAELGEYGYQSFKITDDLVQRVDWSVLVDYDFHPAPLLTGFCRDFRITHDHPNWKPYPGEGTGFWRWIDYLGHGGPDDEFFFCLEIPALPVAMLVEILRTGEWIYPVHWIARQQSVPD